MNNNTAAHLAGLAEFSIQLLQWVDTDRESVLEVQRRVKRETYAQEWGANLDYTPSTLDEVIQAVSDGYWSLKSPRLVKVQIRKDISVTQAPDSIDLLHSVATPVPFVFKNLGEKTVRIRVKGTGEGLEVNPTSSVLKGGQALGLFVSLTSSQGQADSVRLQLEVDQLHKEINLRVRIWQPGRLRVKVRDERGQPTAARIYLTGADGKAYAPDGVLHRITNGDYGQRYGGEYFFYADGEFEVTLPAGNSLLEVVKGLEYVPVKRVVNVSLARTTQVEIALQKPFNMANRGWYSGDVHIHPNMFGDKLIGPKEVLLIAKAEDLNISNLLICNDEASLVNDIERFEGKQNAQSEEKHILYWNQEMRNLRLYGHMGFLNLKKLVEPHYVGWPQTPHPYDYPPNYTQAAKAKAQGAVVTYVHPGLPSEYPVDIALGVADTIDVMCQGDEERITADWYRLLNCGFKCPISAGTDSYLNIPYHLIPGAGRVYVQAGSRLTYQAWIDAYKQGRSFATNAPLLDFKVNGKGPGEEIHWPSGPLKLKVEVEAVSHVPMERMDIVVNGQIVASKKAEGKRNRINLSETVEIKNSSWVAARVRGGAHRLVPNDRALYAHSSPVYCYLAKKNISFKQDALYFVEQIEKLINDVERKGLFEAPEHKRQVIELFRKGQDVYRKIAAGAMLQSP